MRATLSDCWKWVEATNIRLPQPTLILARKGCHPTLQDAKLEL